MKKQTKKLVLSRETLQALNLRLLQGVTGQATGLSDCLECQPVSEGPRC